MAKAFDNVGKALQIDDGRYLDLVWIPWNNRSTMKPVEFSKPRKGKQALKDIGWKGARELINNAYFGYRKNNGRENTRQSCNIRILFNSTYNDRSKVRQQLSEELRDMDDRNQ
eukprot:2352699-Ditylum_brightwellii.AAC.1